MQASEITWLGLIVDDYLVTDEIGRGGMSRIYRASHVHSGAEAVIKVVTTKDSADAELGRNQTCANQLFSGGFGPVHPSPLQLLSMEWKRGMQSGAALCCVGQPAELADGAYGIRPFLKGRTLRKEMSTGITEKLKLLADVALVMSLVEKSAAAYHGDLKPDNVIVQESGIKLIDPGYFGSLHCTEGDIENCVVTTPAYYPLLENDDLFAFGAMSWEVLLSRHPLTDLGAPRQDVGESLRQWVRDYQILGRHSVNSFLSLVLPSEVRADFAGSAETFLLKLLRLRRDLESNKLEYDPGFASFGELLDHLHRAKLT
ncbi:MAG: hypothetical protein K2W95_04110 [Candidatus Obscuribacterales bacterium]|nr:hypothetical protein [Candidatus Obscuribacterales bacterium]